MNSESIKNVTNRAVEQLVEALEPGQSEVLTKYLAAMAKFRMYSFLNVLLILKACPKASRIAGYKTWQSFGRRVKQGEKGIMILAPMFRKREPNTNESDNSEERLGESLASVWSSCGTNSKPREKTSRKSGK
jgi:N-terminal domain of anti-restriction factor ArdC